MCGSMVDIQSPTAETRRGKNKKKKKPQDENIYGLPLTKYFDWLIWSVN